jgi:hypothetical protein
MAGSIEFGEKRCGSVVTPAGEPDLKGLSSGPHVSEAKGINSFEEVLAGEFE